MTTPTPLSPAAQAVLDACLDETCGDELMPSGLRVIAAALRAAADQAIEEVSPVEAILAIAAELEGAR